MESCHHHPDSAATEQLRQRLHHALADALCCSPHSLECQRCLQVAWQALLLGYTEPHRAYHTLSHLEAMMQCLDEAAAWQQAQGTTPGQGEEEAAPSPPGGAHSAAWLHAPGGAHAAAVPASLVLAVFFHDLVYEPQRQDNEEASAQAARETLTQAGASQQVVEDVVTLVLATKDHQLPTSFHPGPGDAPAGATLSGPSSASPQLHHALHALGLSPVPAPRQPQLQPPTGPGAPPGLSPSLSRTGCEVFLDADLSVLAAPSQRYREYSRGIRYEYRHFPDQAYRSGRTAVLEKMLSRPALYFSPWARALGMEAAARANIGRELEELRAESADGA